jgi:hypothetical protein
VAGPELPAHLNDLVQDLELGTLIRAMSSDDRLLFEVAKYGLLLSLVDPEEIVYRQEILGDCLEHTEVIREIYAIAIDAIVEEQKIYHPFGNSPSGTLRRSVEVLQMFVVRLRKLRALADEHLETVASRGLRTFFAMLQHELDDEYFATIDAHLETLKFKDGTLLSADIGRGMRGTRYVLRARAAGKKSLRERMGFVPRNALHFDLAPRDEAGAKLLTEIADRGLNLVANALAQSTDHIVQFFDLLCSEIAFYVGCCNLADRLAERYSPFSMPDMTPPGGLDLSYRGLYDICLALRSGRLPIGNDGTGDGKSLVMITGANSGGKSTLLRSIGLAHMMAQCGMFVAAESLRLSAAEGLFTHFIREEDETMESGKLDEELARMSGIAEEIATGDVILFNESFAATNEREGSEIARQVVDALLDAGVRVFFVTHQFTLADTYFQRHLDNVLFLRAERGENGERTFRLLEGEPLPTSFGEDLYRKLGGWDGDRVPVAVGADNVSEEAVPDVRRNEQ